METSSVDPDIMATARRAATVIYAVVVAVSFAVMFIGAAYLIPAYGPVVGAAGAFAVWAAALWGLHRLTLWGLHRLTGRLLGVACRFAEWMVRRHEARVNRGAGDA